MSIYYQDEQVTLHHGDCLEVMEGLRGEDAAQVIVTSPPYNMGLTPGGNGRGMYRASRNSKGSRFREGYDQHGDAMPQDEYDALHREALSKMWDTIPDDGAIFWNHKQRVEHGVARLPLGMDFPIPLRQVITWDRGTGIGVNKRNYASVAEWIFLFARENFALRDHSASGAGDVWRLGMAREGWDHPAPFPVSLPAMAIRTSGARSVMDPFAGTGSSLVAAREAGVPGIGIEQSEHYCELIAKRLSQGAFDLEGVTA